MHLNESYDVVIIGAGLAGLSLARQLLLETEKNILIVEKHAELPPKRQKVGESLVQVGGYYFSKVLDMEEHLLCEHLMKYNLRFHWKSAGRENHSFEDYGQAYIRPFSNVASYQLDRNKFEGELIRLNQTYARFTCCAPIRALDISLNDDGPHTVSFSQQGEATTVQAQWVVDTTGRSRVLSRRLELTGLNDIRHGTSFIWVDGLVDIDKLTDLSQKEVRLKQDRAATGHLPFWLATNHFMGEGFWFWVIPLQGKTSLGLVYNNALIAREEVATPQKLIAWICREFPLFARDLPFRKILDNGGFKDFSHDCAQTIHPSRWAMSGVAGRFTDPLYSPGSDFIAFHNTLIIDAILTTEADQLARKCQLYELAMRSIYESLLPTFSISYDALGSQESFVLKYTWELSIYFSFFVFPFINDLITDRSFVSSYLAKFSRLGVINKQLQTFISAYYQWSKVERQAPREPLFHDFTSLEPLRLAESTFYQVGLSVEEARAVLDGQLVSLQELARYIVAYVSSVVLQDQRVLTHRAFIDQIDLRNLTFEPAELVKRYTACGNADEPYTWSFDPFVLEQFRAVSQMELVPGGGMG